MRCHICDKTLADDEVQWNNDHKEWDPCGTCLTAISEVFNDDTDEEIEKQVEEEWWFMYDTTTEPEPEMEDATYEG